MLQLHGIRRVGDPDLLEVIEQAQVVDVETPDRSFGFLHFRNGESFVVAHVGEFLLAGREQPARLEIADLEIQRVPKQTFPQHPTACPAAG